MKRFKSPQSKTRLNPVKNPSRILVFGNPRVKSDSLPLKIIPLLKKEFPDIKFEVRDSSEIINQDEEQLWILDTVQGIKDVQLIENLSIFEQNKSLSVHDYDLSFDLNLLLKLGKVKKIKIIAIPYKGSRKVAIGDFNKILGKP